MRKKTQYLGPLGVVAVLLVEPLATVLPTVVVVSVEVRVTVVEAVVEGTVCVLLPVVVERALCV